MTQIWTAENSELVRLGHGQSNFTMDTTRPLASNTGLNVAGLTVGDLTLYDGNMTISTNGATVENMLIRGQVKITGSNVTYRNCLQVGRTMSTTSVFSTGMLEISGNNATVENIEISTYDNTQAPAVDNSIRYINGVKVIGGSATISRCNIHDVVDAFRLSAGTVEVAGNYIHDLCFRTDDTDQASSNPANWSHNDGVQLSGGGGTFNLHGNNFDMRYSQVTGMGSSLTGTMQNCHGMLMQATTSPITGVQVSYNWFAYGNICILWSSPNVSGNTATMLGNRFTPNQDVEFSFWKQMQNNPNSAWTLTGPETTVYSDDPDTPIAYRGQPILAPYIAGGGTQTTWAFNKDAHTP